MRTDTWLKCEQLSSALGSRKGILSIHVSCPMASFGMELHEGMNIHTRKEGEKGKGKGGGTSGGEVGPGIQTPITANMVAEPGPDPRGSGCPTTFLEEVLGLAEVEELKRILTPPKEADSGTSSEMRRGSQDRDKSPIMGFLKSERSEKSGSVLKHR